MITPNNVKLQLQQFISPSLRSILSCSHSRLSKFLTIKEPWLDPTWHLEVTTESLEEGPKETLVNGAVGELEEEMVREIEDVCIGEVFS